MKAIFNAVKDYPDTHYFFYDFDDFDDDKKNLLFAWGIQSGWFDNNPTDFKFKIWQEGEDPHGYAHSGQLPHIRAGGINFHYWDYVTCQCPYTVEWLNNYVYNTDKYIFVKLPTPSQKYWPKISEKKYDIFYQGSAYGSVHSNMINEIKKFNYIWTSLNHHDNRVTHFKTPYLEKLNLLAQTKISIDFNGQFYYGSELDKVKALPNWNLNKAFSHAGTTLGTKFMPQFKTKSIEPMACKTLFITLRNEWDLMEQHGFVENEDFIYFDSIDTLSETIRMCLSEWDYCEKIIENAYKKVCNQNTPLAYYTNYLKKYDE